MHLLIEHTVTEAQFERHR